MQIDIISYFDLLKNDSQVINTVNKALHEKGIIGVKDVPEFAAKSQRFLATARTFFYMDEKVKQQYTPDRVIGRTEGYELGAEKFMDEQGQWYIDDKKASYYAFYPNDVRNKWPSEIDLKTPYLELAELMFNTGQKLLDFIGINQSIGICHNKMSGYGRMLHYQKEQETNKANPNWCGAHFDHGIFTSLLPAYYFKDGIEVDEPKEAGLYIKPTNGESYVKVDASDKSIIYFQVGEFAQLATDDKICATEHLVKKSHDNIERFTLAVFFSAADDTLIDSISVLAKDSRYANHRREDGKVTYLDWQDASYARYHAQ